MGKWPGRLSFLSLACAIALITCVTTSLHAATFNNVPIEYWAGSGPDEAVAVVDFGDVWFAFGYRWDAEMTSPTGRDMLTSIAGSGALALIEENFGFGFFVSELDYLNQPETGASGYPDGWWSYFTSENGITWDLSDDGYSARLLSAGAWDGWALQTTGDWPPANFPAIPEPGSAVILATAAVVLLRGRERC